MILTSPGLQQFSCASVTEIPQRECEALVALYNATDGPNWADNTNWLATSTPSDWYGVTVDAGHVIQLDLEGNQLSGPIPPELGSLANLQELYLNDNQLSGALPLSLMNLNLTSFWFDNTALCEPPDAAFQAWLSAIPDLRRSGGICSAAADVDADGRTDMTVWRPSNGRWYMLKSGSDPAFDYYQATALTWGKSGDIPLLGDVDGDGRADPIVWRNLLWKVYLSGGGIMDRGWGKTGDRPLIGDVDGDGQGGLIVWRPSNGKWYILYSSKGYDYYQAKAYTWGKTGDIPLLGDVDGDGKDDLIVWRNLLWKVALSSTGYSQWMERGWGKTGDIPMPCPWCPSAEDLPLPCLWCTP